MQVSKTSEWECPKAGPPTTAPAAVPAMTTTPAPLPLEPTSACPQAPTPWEAWWDEEYEVCYCWNPLTRVTTWDCPKLPAPPPSLAARPTTTAVPSTPLKSTPRPGIQFTCFTSTNYKYCCATCGKLLHNRRSKALRGQVLSLLALLVYTSTSSGNCCASYACASPQKDSEARC